MVFNQKYPKQLVGRGERDSAQRGRAANEAAGRPRPRGPTRWAVASQIYGKAALSLPRGPHCPQSLPSRMTKEKAGRPEMVAPEEEAGRPEVVATEDEMGREFAARDHE